MDKPLVVIDLEHSDENPFLVIGYARQTLIGEPLDAFDQEVAAALQPGSGKTYEDILAIVDTYVCLVDTSATHAAYTVDEVTIMAAIRQLNGQLKTLPFHVISLVEDLYPDTNATRGLVNYMTLVEQEIERVEDQIDSGEPYQVLLAMLQECLGALQKARTRLATGNKSAVPLQAPVNRYHSHKPMYVEFITKGGHMASSGFRDTVLSGVRAVEAILGKWTNMTPGNVQAQYTGGRIYNNITGSLLCYGNEEEGLLRWYDANGQRLIVDLSVLGDQER